MTFDKVSKRLASDCTPKAAQETLNVTITTDPISGTRTLTPPTGYNARAYDNYHSCNDTSPFISDITASKDASGNKWIISVMAQNGTHPITGTTISVNGNTYDANVGDTGSWDVVLANLSGNLSVTATVTDEGYYTQTMTKTLNFSGGSNSSSDEDKQVDD